MTKNKNRLQFEAFYNPMSLLASHRFKWIVVLRRIKGIPFWMRMLVSAWSAVNTHRTCGLPAAVLFELRWQWPFVSASAPKQLLIAVDFMIWFRLVHIMIHFFPKRGLCSFLCSLTNAYFMAYIIKYTVVFEEWLALVQSNMNFTLVMNQCSVPYTAVMLMRSVDFLHQVNTSNWDQHAKRNSA